MTAATAPAVADDPRLQQRPAIGPGFRLQWEPAQEAHVLLYPEGVVKLNGSAGEILTRCDGRRTVAEIIGALQAEFGMPDLRADVLAFLDIAQRQRWVALA